jgi:hypothetical protein
MHRTRELIKGFVLVTTSIVWVYTTMKYLGSIVSLS